MTKGPRYILLVDDDEPTNFLNRKVIEGWGQAEEVHVFETGPEALAFLAANRGAADDQPGLLFLDINMPGMDGWEFLEHYQQTGLSADPNIVIVMLTTSLNPDDEIRARDLSVIHEFRIKPLTPGMLTAIGKSYFE